MKFSKDPIPWDEIDPEIRPIVRLLNEQPGVETLYSCAGHETDPGQLSGYVTMHIDTLEDLQGLVRKIGPRVLTMCYMWTRRADRPYPTRDFLSSAYIECHELDEHGVVFTLHIEGQPMWAQRTKIEKIELALNTRGAAFAFSSPPLSRSDQGATQ